jgi:hypothetical protein
MLLVSAVMMMPVTDFCGALLTLSLSLSPLRPLKYDQYIYAFDSLLGQPNFVLGSLFTTQSC